MGARRPPWADGEHRAARRRDGGGDVRARPLFGFGNDSDAGTSAACGHYWECSRNQSRYFGGKSGYHDWHAQWRVLSDWVATGVVSYFERRPGTP